MIAVMFACSYNVKLQLTTEIYHKTPVTHVMVKLLSTWLLNILGTENLALYKPTDQSSTHGGYTSALAVDGIYDSYFNIAHTDNDGVKWWRINLISIYSIGLIELYNRESLCKCIKQILFS